MDSYCTVRMKWKGSERRDAQVVHPASFEEVVALLKQVRDRHADECADWLAEDPNGARSVGGDMLGGFGVEVTNRWGSVVEVGPGRDVWFLFRHQPRPSVCHTDHPPIDGTRVFFLDGGHHTELGRDMLVSREECLRVLRDWLDTGVFPDQEARRTRRCT